MEVVPNAMAVSHIKVGQQSANQQSAFRLPPVNQRQESANQQSAFQLSAANQHSAVQPSHNHSPSVTPRPAPIPIQAGSNSGHGQSHKVLTQSQRHTVTASDDSFSSDFSDSSEEGPARAPPRKENVVVRQRSLSQIEEVLYMAHTDCKSEIPDGLTLKRGQKLKVWFGWMVKGGRGIDDRP